MSSMITSCREALLAALAETPTVNVRDVLAASLGRVPAANEINAARQAAHRIAHDGKAVLMTLYPDQVKGVERRRGDRRALLHLTVDRELILSLPYRVEVATENWTADLEEGKKRTQEKIDNDPILSRYLRGPSAVPSPPRPAHEGQPLPAGRK